MGFLETDHYGSVTHDRVGYRHTIFVELAETMALWEAINYALQFSSLANYLEGDAKLIIQALLYERWNQILATSIKDSWKDQYFAG